MDLNLIDETWVPDACTLPSADQPLRVAEFDAFFANDVTRVDRTAGGTLAMTVRAEAAGRGAELAVKETGCCSFFTFVLTITGGSVALLVTAPGHDDVLAALADRAEHLLPEVSR